MVRKPQLLKEDPLKINFYEAAQGKNAAEVSRLFLATLFLANTGNVQVVPPNRAYEMPAGKVAPSKRGGSKKVFEPEGVENAMTVGAETKGAVQCVNAVQWVNAGFDLRLVNEMRQSVF